MPTSLRRRLILAAVLYAVLFAAQAARACEPALLRLILSRDVQGEFESSMRGLSAILLDAGRAARAGDPPNLRGHADRFLESWKALYTKVYLEPPRGHKGGGVWRSRIDALTRRAADLDPGRLPEDLAAIHPILQDLQDHLASFYLPDPGTLSPTDEFEVLRALATDQDAALRAEGQVWQMGHRRLERFVERAAKTADKSPGWDEFLAYKDGMKAALARGDTPPKLAPAVEKLRTATLAALWFPGGSP